MKNQPRLQNILIHTEVGDRLRKAFAQDRPVLPAVDYSQIELRLLAHYDKGLFKYGASLDQLKRALGVKAAAFEALYGKKGKNQ